MQLGCQLLDTAALEFDLADGGESHDRFTVWSGTETNHEKALVGYTHRPGEVSPEISVFEPALRRLSIVSATEAHDITA